MIDWYVSALAEWTVAWQENWRLEQISGRAWLFAAVHAALLIALLVAVV